MGLNGAQDYDKCTVTVRCPKVLQNTFDSKSVIFVISFSFSMKMMCTSASGPGVFIT